MEQGSDKDGQMVDLCSLLLEHNVVEESIVLFNSIHKEVFFQST